MRPRMVGIKECELGNSLQPQAKHVMMVQAALESSSVELSLLMKIK